MSLEQGCSNAHSAISPIGNVENESERYARPFSRTYSHEAPRTAVRLRGNDERCWHGACTIWPIDQIGWSNWTSRPARQYHCTATVHRSRPRCMDPGG